MSSDDIVRRMELMDVPPGSYDEETLYDAVDEIKRLRVNCDRWRAVAAALVEASEIQVSMAKVPKSYTKPFYSQHLKDALKMYELVLAKETK